MPLKDFFPSLPWFSKPNKDHIFDDVSNFFCEWVPRDVDVLEKTKVEANIKHVVRCFWKIQRARQEQRSKTIFQELPVFFENEKVPGTMESQKFAEMS